MFAPFYFLLYGTLLVLNVYCYRLPTSVAPTYYRLKILSHLGSPEPENFNYDGQVWIKIECHEPTQNITLHAQTFNIKNADVSVQNITLDQENFLKIKNIERDLSNNFLIIHLDEPLSVGHQFEIYIPFNAVLSEGLKGFYRSSYIDGKTNEKRWLGATQFEPISARKAFPCFDEPAMKAVYNISIGRSKHYSSISNMPIISTNPVKEKKDWFWDNFALSVPMSTYLVAFIVSDFGYKQSDASPGNNVTIRIWTKKDALDQVDYAREVSPKALEYFEHFFNISYPLPKQDMVALPDFGSGAMENWGLITYRESALLYDSKISSLQSQYRIASVIAHELAHQWFGNLVTMKWWTDLWLNEGFATYMASRAIEDLNPAWKSFQESSVSNFLTVLSFDSLRSSHPVSVPIGHPNQIDEIFDTISYKKGSFLIRMMSLLLGDKTVSNGVSNYLRMHEYQNAEQDDLWECLTMEAHKNGALPKNITVKTIMDTWTLQTGYPVITVNRDYKKKTASLSQSRYSRDGIVEKSEQVCWWVPITYTDQNELNFNQTQPKLWLNCHDHDGTINSVADNKWILLNIQIGSLYRVNYDEDNWKLITQTLKSESHTMIPVLNKVQLIDDAYALASSGSLKYEIFFELVDYLRSENEYLPWRAAISNIASINRQIKKSAIYGDFKFYIKGIIKNIFEAMKDAPAEDMPNDLESVRHRALVYKWACYLELESCLLHARELFTAFIQKPQDKDTVPKDLRSVIYCTAVRNGGEFEWNFLWEQYKNSHLASEQSMILSALGCTRDVWLHKRYLEWSITANSGIRKQDSAIVFSAVANNEVGFFVAKKFLMDRFQDIFTYLGESIRRLASYLSAIASQTTSQEDYDELENFIKNNSQTLLVIKQGVDQSLETAKFHVNWQHKHFNKIKILLGNYADEQRKKL